MAKHYLKVIYYATETSWKSNSKIKVLVGLRHANGCFKKSFQCILVSLFQTKQFAKTDILISVLNQQIEQISKTAVLPM